MLPAPSFPSQELRVIQEHGMDNEAFIQRVSKKNRYSNVAKNRPQTQPPNYVNRSKTQPHTPLTTSYAFLRAFLSPITCQLQHRSSESVAKFHSLQGDWSIATASNFIVQKLSCATSYALSTSGFNL